MRLELPKLMTPTPMKVTSSIMSASGENKMKKKEKKEEKKRKKSDSIYNKSYPS